MLRSVFLKEAVIHSTEIILCSIHCVCLTSKCVTLQHGFVSQMPYLTHKLGLHVVDHKNSILKNPDFSRIWVNDVM